MPLRASTITPNIWSYERKTPRVLSVKTMHSLPFNVMTQCVKLITKSQICGHKLLICGVDICNLVSKWVFNYAQFFCAYFMSPGMFQMSRVKTVMLNCMPIVIGLHILHHNCLLKNNCYENVVNSLRVETCIKYILQNSNRDAYMFHG